MASRSSVPSANVLTRKRPAVSSTISILIGFLDIPDELCGAGWVPDALGMNRTHPFSSRQLTRQLMIEDLFYNQWRGVTGTNGTSAGFCRDVVFVLAIATWSNVFRSSGSRGQGRVSPCYLACCVERPPLFFAVQKCLQIQASQRREFYLFGQGTHNPGTVCPGSG